MKKLELMEFLASVDVATSREIASYFDEPIGNATRCIEKKQGLVVPLYDGKEYNSLSNREYERLEYLKAKKDTVSKLKTRIRELEERIKGLEKENKRLKKIESSPTYVKARIYELIDELTARRQRVAKIMSEVKPGSEAERRA